MSETVRLSIERIEDLVRVEIRGIEGIQDSIYDQVTAGKQITGSIPKGSWDRLYEKVEKEDEVKVGDRVLFSAVVTEIRHDGMVIVRADSGDYFGVGKNAVHHVGEDREITFNDCITEL